ncbi:MAG: SIMPL domain-containing protein, partial [Cyanobacteria bacterium J06648_11]
MKHSLWALGLAVVLGVSGGAAPMRAQDIASMDERVLTVTGRGSTLVETAIATIRLGVEVSGANAERVQAEVAERSNAVIEQLR